MLAFLDDSTLRGFDRQKGLNRRSFWQRSFRSHHVSEPAIFQQKVRYIHENPVRTGLCRTAVEYRWSSARAWELGLWSDELGLDPIALGEHFATARSALGYCGRENSLASTTTEVAEA